jgi:hypothetical protein
MPKCQVVITIIIQPPLFLHACINIDCPYLIYLIEFKLYLVILTQ